MAKYWLGKKHTEEYKKKMAEALSGKNNPRYGMRLSDSLKQKISQSIIKHYQKNGTDYLKGKRPQTSKSLTGHPVSIITRKKISEQASKRQIGENNPNWKGGITPIAKKIRRSLEYEEWRIKVFERNNYICQSCGKIGGELNADHIKPFALFPELRLDINNGQTLCENCHRLKTIQDWKKYKFLPVKEGSQI